MRAHTQAANERRKRKRNRDLRFGLFLLNSVLYRFGVVSALFQQKKKPFTATENVLSSISAPSSSSYSFLYCQIKLVDCMVVAYALAHRHSDNRFWSMQLNNLNLYYIVIIRWPRQPHGMCICEPYLMFGFLCLSYGTQVKHTIKLVTHLITLRMRITKSNMEKRASLL